MVFVIPSRDSNQLFFLLIFNVPGRTALADFKLFDSLARQLERLLGSPRGSVSLGVSH